LAEVREAFLGTLLRILPDIPREVLMWRAHFFIGSFIQGLIAEDDLDLIGQGMLDAEKDDPVRYLTEFATAGFRAGFGGE
jgi:hypothetical protein